MSAKQRLLGKDNYLHYYEDRGVLFCRTCLSYVDHSRQSLCEQRLRSKKHLKNADDIPDRSLKQKTLQSSINVQSQGQFVNVKVILDYVRMLIATNSPPNHVSHPETQLFFKNHVRAGGSLPQTHMGLHLYKEDIFAAENDLLKERLKKFQSYPMNPAMTKG